MRPNSGPHLRRSQSPITIRCMLSAKVIRRFSLACQSQKPRQIHDFRHFPEALLLRLLIRSGCPGPPQIPALPDSRTPRPLFLHWSVRATRPAFRGELSTPGVSALVFEFAGSHEGGRSPRDANFEGPVANGHGRNQGHPSPLQCRSGWMASQPFSN